MAFLIGSVFGVFIVCLLVAVVWLIITKLIAPMRRRPSVSYGIAMALVALVVLVQINGSVSVGIVAIGAGICELLLFWQYMRERRKLIKGAK